MAVAGKVAITLSTENSGAWSADVTYDRLVAVKHNNNLYISRKTVTNVEPPNDEFWFLALEGYSGEDVQALIDSINNIIDGTTQVGNAGKLGGFTAQELFRYYSKRDVETDINTLLVSGIYRNNKFVNYPPEHTDGQGIVIVLNYSSANNLVVEGTIGTDSAWLKQIFISPHNGKMWERYVSNKTISDWHSMTDADTVDGYHASELPYLPLTGGTLGGGVTNTPIVFKGNDGECWSSFINNSGTNLGFFGFNTQDSPIFALGSSPSTRHSILHTGNMASHVLPLTGGRLSNSDGTPLTLQGGAYSILRYDNANKEILGWLGFGGANKPVVYMNDLTKYDLLHTGNKPTGTYTGNGSATERTIATGGIGNVCYVTGNGLAIVYNGGAILVSNGTVTAVKANEAKFVNGVMTLATTNAILNVNGATLTYQVP